MSETGWLTPSSLAATSPAWNIYSAANLETDDGFTAYNYIDQIANSRVDSYYVIAPNNSYTIVSTINSFVATTVTATYNSLKPSEIFSSGMTLLTIWTLYGGVPRGANYTVGTITHNLPESVRIKQVEMKASVHVSYSFDGSNWHHHTYLTYLGFKIHYDDMSGLFFCLG